MSPVATLDKAELRSLIADVIDIDAEKVGDQSDFVDDLEVDSLMALEVVVVLEKHYGVKLVESELKQVTCLANAYDLLSGKLHSN